jgi:hypothetical protein
MNISLLLNDIHTTLSSADRPEHTLYQRYETYSDDQKKEFVIALIGKVIEQDRMIASARRRRL